MLKFFFYHQVDELFGKLPGYERCVVLGFRFVTARCDAIYIERVGRNMRPSQPPPSLGHMAGSQAEVSLPIIVDACKMVANFCVCRPLSGIFAFPL
jgi:hypothetical protein